MKFKRILPAIIAASLALGALSACGGDKEAAETPVSSTEGAATPTPAPAGTNEPLAPHSPSPVPPAFTCEDEKGLVRVHIIDGQAFLQFDFAQWEALYQISGLAAEMYYDLALTFGGEGGKLFPVETEGRVIAAAAAQVADLDYMQYSTFVCPSVLLLLEDGGAEWVHANPFHPGQGEVVLESFESNGRLPWVEGIEAVTAETEALGVGATTFIAVDGAGRRYDLRELCILTNAYDGEWCMTLISYEDSAPVTGWLRLEPDGSAAFRVGYADSELLEEWEGRYTVTLAESDANTAHGIVFDMTIAGRYFEGGSDASLPQVMKGTYGFSVNLNGDLMLYREGGDALCPTFILDSPGYYYCNLRYFSNEVYREDADGLVRVIIRDGVPTVMLDIARWDAMHNYRVLMQDEPPHPEGIEYEILDVAGRVADAVIGKVEALDKSVFFDFVRPAVFLLMEDGTVEWFHVMPDLLEMYFFHSYGSLPWITDITALSYEAVAEGSGEEHTVYAYDSGGTRYDLSIPCIFNGLFYMHWSCDFGGGMKGRLLLFDDNTCTFEVYADGAERTGWYAGTYAVTLTEGQRTRPGMISFDLAYTEGDGASAAGGTIQGDYFFESMPEGFKLYLADGDGLYGAEAAYAFYWE